MPNFRKIKIFNLNSSSVWALSWSNLGNFLVSCTSDGMYFLWGKRSSAIIKNSKNKIEIERKIFQNWNCLEFSLKKKKNLLFDRVVILLIFIKYLCVLLKAFF